MTNSLFRWILWFGATAVWTVLLVLPVSGPEFGDSEEVRQMSRFWIAKTAHVSIYAGWAILTGWLRAPLQGRLLLLMFLMAHGTLTEWAQTFVPDRTGLLRDAALDQLGVFLGVAASWRWWSSTDSA